MTHPAYVEIKEVSASPSLKELVIQFGRDGLKDMERVVIIIAGSKCYVPNQLGKFRGSDKAWARDRETFLERQCWGRVAEVACWDCWDLLQLLAEVQQQQPGEQRTGTLGF